MTHGSLFSGIGGFDLAAEWIGWENVFHCEINPFCQKVLKYHFPNAESLMDIKTTNFKKYNGTIDIISGGFPCQPYSQPGKRKGKEDERHLWPEMLRAIREIQPSWIVGENVPGLLNWNRGMVLAEIKTDLESEGFEVLPPCILPACSKNAPHRRDRLWIIAHSNKNGSFKNDIQKGINNKKHSERFIDDNGLFSGIKQSPQYIRGNDGLSTKLDEDRVGALGNAIVPQVAFEIFKAIEQMELNYSS